MATPNNIRSGVLPVYKPKGMSSFDVIRALKKHYRGAKFGHAGSLDPIAEGVVLILVNDATKQSNLLMDGLKVYDVEMVLGMETDSGDITGQYLERVLPGRNNPVDRSELQRVLKKYIGEFDQTIPAFSACKYHGKPRYLYARKGIDVEEKKRKVMINHIELMRYDYPMVEMRVFCQRGVYLRALCQDVGRDLGRGGVLLNLIRVACGGFELSRAVTLDCLTAGEAEAEMAINSLLAAPSKNEARIRVLS